MAKSNQIPVSIIPKEWRLSWHGQQPQRLLGSTAFATGEGGPVMHSVLDARVAPGCGVP